MGKASRDKGAAGEREFCIVARQHDLPADRTAQLQAGRVPGAPDVLIRTWPELYVEVKRDERMSVDAMVRQANADAARYPGEARVPIVAWRRNGSGRQGWRLDMPAAFGLALLAEVHELRDRVDLLERERGLVVEGDLLP
jgi:hypothetical protein